MECLFCEIVNKKKKAYIIEENQSILAILDVSPLSDGHVLLITKQHFADVSEIDEVSWKHLYSLLKKVIEKLKEVLQPQGFNFITNMGKEAYQSVFHLHFHVIPKYNKEEGFIWKSQPELKYSLGQIAEKLK